MRVGLKKPPVAKEWSSRYAPTAMITLQINFIIDFFLLSKQNVRWSTYEMNVYTQVGLIVPCGGGVALGHYLLLESLQRLETGTSTAERSM